MFFLFVKWNLKCSLANVPRKMVPDFHPIAKYAKPVGTYYTVLMLSGWEWLIQHWKQQTTNMVALVTLACEEHQVISKFSWLRSEPMEASPFVPLPHSGGRLWFPWLCECQSCHPGGWDQVQNWGDVEIATGCGMWFQIVPALWC